MNGLDIGIFFRFIEYAFGYITILLIFDLRRPYRYSSMCDGQLNPIIDLNYDHS